MMPSILMVGCVASVPRWRPWAGANVRMRILAPGASAEQVFCSDDVARLRGFRIVRSHDVGSQRSSPPCKFRPSHPMNPVEAFQVSNGSKPSALVQRRVRRNSGDPSASTRFTTALETELPRVCSAASPGLLHARLHNSSRACRADRDRPSMGRRQHRSPRTCVAPSSPSSSSRPSRSGAASSPRRPTRPASPRASRSWPPAATAPSSPRSSSPSTAGVGLARLRSRLRVLRVPRGPCSSCSCCSG